MPITQYLHHQRFSPAAIRLRAMTNETETLTSGIDPASFSSVIKPTNDLFRYVNGPWIDTYRLPDDRSRYGSFDKLAEDAENQVRDILDADDCPAVKSEALYRSFLNTDAIEAAGLDPIRDELDLIDSAIDKAALTRVLGTINPAGGPDLFGLAVYGDPGDPDRNIAHLEQAGLCLPDEAYYREDHYAPVREAYVAMVATQLVNAGYAPAAESNGGDELPSNTGDDESNAPATVPSEAALGMARHFLAVETKIAANHWDNVATRDSVKTYNPTDYADLAATLKNFDLGSWIDAWQTAYDATEAAKAQPIDFKSVFARVIVHEPSFLTGLDAFWAEADLADLKLWARVHMILGFASSLSRDFDTTNFDFGTGPFAHYICTSVNDAVLHGVPYDYSLKDGDLVSLDLAISVDGWVADSAVSFVVGKDPDPEDLRIIKCTEEALAAAIDVAKPGNRLGDISNTIGDVAREYGYPINLEFGGHGVGHIMHGDPHVPNDGRAHHGYKLREGLVIAIEPWFLKTTDEIFQDPKDGWTLRASDGSRGAHSEHTIAITENGPIVFTDRTNL